MWLGLGIQLQPPLDGWIWWQTWSEVDQTSSDLVSTLWEQASSDVDRGGTDFGKWGIDDGLWSGKYIRGSDRGLREFCERYWVCSAIKQCFERTKK